MFDSRLTRWISQAIHDAFDLETPVFFENQYVDRSKHSQCVEVRVHGPNFHHVNGGWKIQVFINALVTATKTNDLYVMERILGPVVAVLSTPIVVRQKGLETDEDLTVVGCLNPAGAVEISNQGTLVKESTAMQATAENVFYMDIKE